MSWALIGLKLLGIGQWLKKAASAIFGWTLAHPWQAAVIVLAALSLWLHHGKTTMTHDRDRWQAAFVKQKTDYIAAQKLAAKKAGEARAATENLSRSLAHETDLQGQLAQAQGASDTARYAAANRLRDQAACRAAGGAAAGAVPDAAALDDGSGSAADMVVVSPADLSLLTAAALRAAENKRYADALIAAGLALPEPAPTPAPPSN